MDGLETADECGDAVAVRFAFQLQFRTLASA
jgi:hypothetical protein